VAYLDIEQGGEHIKGSEEQKSSNWVQKQSSCGVLGQSPQEAEQFLEFKLNPVHVIQ